MSAVKDSISRETIATVESVAEYEHGFITDIEMEMAPKGLNTDIVRYISGKKNEPEWMLDWRLAAYERWLTMQEHEKIHHCMWCKIFEKRRREPYPSRPRPLNIFLECSSK